MLAPEQTHRERKNGLWKSALNWNNAMRVTAHQQTHSLWESSIRRAAGVKSNPWVTGLSGDSGLTAARTSQKTLFVRPLN